MTYYEGREYENPMVNGDYPGYDAEDYEARCTRCGRIWYGYNTGGMIEWECNDVSFASPFDMPTGVRVCRACAWELRTKKQCLAYIEATDLKAEVIGYALSGKIAHMMINENAANLFDIAVESECEEISMWISDMIDDYINDNKRCDFVDWIVEGGYHE